MRHRARLADQIAGRTEQLDDLRPRFGGRFPHELVVELPRAIGIDRFPSRGAPCDRTERAVGLNHRADRQAELAPPDHVGEIAERADHRDAAALCRIGQRVRPDRHADAEERREHVPAEERLVARIVRVRDERDARGNELGTRRLDFDGAGGTAARRRIRDGELDAVVRARHLAVLELGLRDRGLEIDVPERRRLELIRQPPAQQAQERQLRDVPGSAADGRVGHRPVDREPERLPEVLERLLVFAREPVAELDEVRPRHRDRLLVRFLGRHERRVVRQRRIAAHAVVVLHAALGRQAVVVPSHRVEDRLAAHPVKARHDVGVREREDVADMERPAHRRRGRVDGEDFVARPRTIEPEDGGLFPARHPLDFESFERRFLRQPQAGRIEARQRR